MSKQLLIKNLKNYFGKKENILLAFLFGSHSKNRITQKSDVDIAIWLKNKHSFSYVNKIWNEIEYLIKAEIDLIVLNDAPPTLSWSALRGIPIVIRDYAFYLEYMLQISREAEDFQEFILDLWKWREKIKKSNRARK